MAGKDTRKPPKEKPLTSCLQAAKPSRRRYSHSPSSHKTPPKHPSWTSVIFPQRASPPALVVSWSPAWCRQQPADSAAHQRRLGRRPNSERLIVVGHNKATLRLKLFKNLRVVQMVRYGTFYSPKDIFLFAHTLRSHVLFILTCVSVPVK